MIAYIIGGEAYRSKNSGCRPSSTLTFPFPHYIWGGGRGRPGTEATATLYGNNLGNLNRSKICCTHTYTPNSRGECMKRTPAPVLDLTLVIEVKFYLDTFYNVINNLCAIWGELEVTYIPQLVSMVGNFLSFINLINLSL